LGLRMYERYGKMICYKKVPECLGKLLASCAPITLYLLSFILYLLGTSKNVSIL